MCDEYFLNVNSIFVIFQKNGDPFTVSGLRGRWRKTKARAKKATGLALDFTFHDLKAKGITDFKGSEEEKRQAAGHTNIRQTRD